MGIYLLNSTCRPTAIKVTVGYQKHLAENSLSAFSLTGHLYDDMITSPLMSVAANNDAELVCETLAGNREAFERIVSRYQSLVCSLAYSATGNLGESEDLAQETFITAWKHLGHLRERHKLRPWLCGIARNRINSFLRREGREPLREAESLETAAESHSAEPAPAEQAISREEEAILWRSLEKIPETYREPLILFYREQQSAARVAEALDISEDTVHQRLSRGRKLLQQEILGFVEGALNRTNPGRAFTLGVLAALPATMVSSAKAAALGTAAAKGGLTVKGAAAGGLFAGIFGGLLVFFGNYLGYRMGLDEAHTPAEQSYVKAFYRRIGVVVGLVFLGCAALVLSLGRDQADRLFVPSLLINGLIVIYLLVTFAFVLATTPGRRKYYQQVNATEGSAKPAYEFRTRATFLGLPLIHIRIGDRFDILREPVRAWIAVANYAIGGLFAFGGIALAPVSIGFCAVGLLPFGGIALGAVALGGFALGGWAFGGLAIGWQSLGSLALAWNAASGSLAVAHDFALGPVARAAQVNTDAVRDLIHSRLFFRWAQIGLNHALWLNLLWVTPLFVQSRIIARAKRPATPAPAK